MDARPRAPSTRGLSPRVRGSPPELPPPQSESGSIPACAGEPSARPSAPAPERVYPRVCGGAFPATVRSADESGLSPRVRGSHVPGVRHDRVQGSIPACAGEPRPPAPPDSGSRVYPRVCGGAVQFPFVGIGDRGLSPRVRGSRLFAGDQLVEAGSIPACAGEPRSRRRLRSPSAVYPRVCGGAFAAIDRSPSRFSCQ